MPWSDAAVSADFTLSAGQPWRPLPADHHLYNTISQQNVSVQAVRHALQVHRSAVPVYVNGIFSSIGHFHPTRSSNLQVGVRIDSDVFWCRVRVYGVLTLSDVNDPILPCPREWLISRLHALLHSYPWRYPSVWYPGM